MDLTLLALTVGVLATPVATILAWSILRELRGQRQMEKIADHMIHESPRVFMKNRHIFGAVCGNAKKHIEGNLWALNYSDTFSALLNA
jgi:hypothetical protein